MKVRHLTLGLGLSLGLGGAALALVPATAQASTCYPASTCTPPQIDGSPIAPAAVAPAAAAPPAAYTGASSSLAFTGADLGELTAVGLGVLGFGTVLVRRSRRPA